MRAWLRALAFTGTALLAGCGVTIPNPAMGPTVRGSPPVPLMNVLVVMDVRPECELHPADQCQAALKQFYAPVASVMTEAVTDTGARATVLYVTSNADLPPRVEGYSHVWTQELKKLAVVTEGGARQGMQRSWVAYIAHRTTGRQMERAIEMEYASDGVMCFAKPDAYRNSSECQRLYRAILKQQLNQYRAGT